MRIQSGDKKLGFEALNRLAATIRGRSHDFKSSTEIFPTLEVDTISRTLELERHGTERGNLNQPPPSQKALDEIEQSVVERVETEKKTAHQIVEDQFQSFTDRLINLDFEGQFGLIRQANASSVSDFAVAAMKGANDLHVLREQLKTAHEERSDFKQDNNLKRAARVSSGSYTTFKYLFLVFLLLAETGLNGTFLAEGNEQGLVGGFSKAFMFSVLNVGVALFAAFFSLRLFAFRSLFWKLVGLVSFGAYVVLAFGLNLALSHYREVSQTMFNEASTAVITRMTEAPFQFQDINSWLMFGFGILCSLAALIDGYFLTDPHIGFAGVENRVRHAFENYNSSKEDLLGQLTEIRDEHNSKVEEIIKDLSDRRTEHSAIISHRQRILNLFAEHQNQLERTANTLLTIYRSANIKSRKDPQPKSFSTPYKMSRIKIAVNPTGEWNDQDLANSIRESQTVLTNQIQEVDKEFLGAVRRYRELDDLFPGNGNGQA